VSQQHAHLGLHQTHLQNLTKLNYDARFGFYAPDQILNVSLNVFKKRVATRHKTLIKTRINELLIFWNINIKLYLGEPLSYDSISRNMFY
jgi:hypothetical protein